MNCYVEIGRFLMREGQALPLPGLEKRCYTKASGGTYMKCDSCSSTECLMTLALVIELCSEQISNKSNDSMTRQMLCEVGQLRKEGTCRSVTREKFRENYMEQQRTMFIHFEVEDNKMPYLKIIHRISQVAQTLFSFEDVSEKIICWAEAFINEETFPSQFSLEYAFHEFIVAHTHDGIPEDKICFTMGWNPVLGYSVILFACQPPNVLAISSKDETESSSMYVKYFDGRLNIFFGPNHDLVYRWRSSL